MGGKSSIDQLSDELRGRLIEMLNQPSVTQQQITDAVNAAAGKTVVSKSAVNRYAMRMREFTEHNRQAREMAEVLLQQQGEQTHNVLGKSLNEMLRTLSFDLLAHVPNLPDQDPQEKIAVVSGLISKMSRAMRDLEQASKINFESAQAIRKMALEEAAKKIGESRKPGLTKETKILVRREILGLL